MSIAESAARTRDDALRATTEARIDYAKSGQSLAFGITLMAFVCSVVFFALGNRYAGTAFLGVPVVMLVRAFLGRFGSKGDDD